MTFDAGLQPETDTLLVAARGLVSVMQMYYDDVIEGDCRGIKRTGPDPN